MKKNNFSHLPTAFMDQPAYDHLYRNNFGVDELDWSDGDWQEIQLEPELSAIEVYRKLPSAEKFEYGGYLTETAIRYVRCRETSATTISENSCTFHSHPTDLAGTEPDLPSAKDIYSFIRWKQLRAITVGKELIWVLDKTIETIPVIEKLVRWEELNMVSTFHGLQPTEKHDLSTLYSHHVLKEFGLDWPKSSKDVSNRFHKQWPKLLSQTLQIEVSVFPRARIRGQAT